MDLLDVIIVGGGPAGLNAAVVLGRCRCKVLLFDTGKQRNRMSEGMHNYLTRDDILPSEFLDIARRELSKYGVACKPVGIKNVHKNAEGIFEAVDNNNITYYAKKILIATGLTDKLPDIEGFDRFYGNAVYHCPYCDGWEVRDKRLAVYGRNKNGFELALSLLTWSKSVTYFSDGRKILSPGQVEKLQRHHIPVIHERIVRLTGKERLEHIVLAGQKPFACDAIFFVNGFSQQCNIVESLGCNMNNKSAVLVNGKQQSNIPGVYVAGDACKDMHFVIVAAAEGAKAGVNINKELQREAILELAELEKADPTPTPGQVRRPAIAIS